MNKIRLRYLQITTYDKRWDERSKKWEKHGYKSEPLLQYFDGREWIEPKLVTKIIKK